THAPRSAAATGLVVGLAALLGCAAGPARAAAQESPLVAEAHVGVAAPVGSFANGSGAGEGAGPGLSFGVDFALPGGGRWTPYVGFAQHRFACEDAGCAAGGRYVATGFHGGVRVALVTGHALVPWVRAGAVSTRVEAGDLLGAGAVTELGIGGEAAAGVHIGAASQLAVNPSLRFVAVDTDLPGGPRLAMRYLVADVAVVLSF
ncbi:MAG TPA: hypothetical protein VFQ22_13655, partial [Longimicrobiales bacterium]|nr:hypothetical protein [Longimicrobiales bacterium]